MTIAIVLLTDVAMRIRIRRRARQQTASRGTALRSRRFLRRSYCALSEDGRSDLLLEGVRRAAQQVRHEREDLERAGTLQRPPRCVGGAGPT